MATGSGHPLDWVIVAAGLVVGVLYGLFGVGSSFATPALVLMGVPGMSAVVGPLPALLPGSAAGAWSYHRAGRVDRTLALRVIIAALPAAALGAYASQWVGDTILVAASGLMLLLVGVRIVRGDRRGSLSDTAHLRRDDPVLVSTMAVGVGFAAGLLANGGGFLLVPLFLLVLGLEMNEAAGTSMVVATVLTIPILVTHALVGDLQWLVALPFALGLVPGAMVGGHLATRLPTHRLQTAFGVVLIAVALYMLVDQAG